MYNIIRMARRKNPYTVVELDFEHFIDFKGTNLTDSMKVDIEGKPVRWSKVVSVRLLKEDPGHVWAKYSYEDESYKCVRVIPRALRGRATPSLKLPDVADLVLYEGRLPISSAKKGDLLKLCKENTIPSVYHNFYKELPCSTRVGDRLPEPDVLESSEDSD